MTISKNLFCEILIRDFAKKYLGLTEPFELQDIIELDIEKFPSDISDDEIYTLADIRYCMRILKLVNPFSHIRIDEYTEIDTKEIISYEDFDLKIFLYEIISSLPDTGSYIKRCKNCGRLFISNHKNRIYCHGLDSDGDKCDEVGSIKSCIDSKDRKADNLYTMYYKRNWNNVKRGKITKDEFESWKIQGKNECNKVKDGKISIIDFEIWLDVIQKSML